MIRLGVPYPQGFDAEATEHLMRQAGIIASNLRKDGIETAPGKEIIALIAYLQRLGTDIKGSKLSTK